MPDLTLAQNAKRHNFNGVDIVKFICAVLVVTIHIAPFPTDFPFSESLDFWIRNCICRIAVPFYFVASGFFLFRKIDFGNVDKNIVRDYCFRILRLFGTWTFLLFFGGIAQLWYLGALVVAVIILSVLINKGIKLRYIGIISVVLFIIGLLGDSYYGLIEPLKSFQFTNLIISGYDKVFETTRNGVFFGFLFVFMGAVFAKKRINLNKNIAFSGFIISVALLATELYLLETYSSPKNYNMMISLVPATFFLFAFATSIDLKDRPIYKKMRGVGMLIFYTHLAVNGVVDIGIAAVNKFVSIDLVSYEYILTLLFTIVLAVSIESLSNKKRFFWLKYLYT